MSDFSAAVTAGADGSYLEVEVSPGSHSARFPDGFNPWRGRLRVRVRAPPEDGKANREVLELVAARLGCARDAITLTAGATSSQKTVHVHGMDPETVLRALEGSTP